MDPEMFNRILKKRDELVILYKLEGDLALAFKAGFVSGAYAGINEMFDYENKVRSE